MSDRTQADEWGRPLSDDGRWYWDGTAWRAHSGPPATSDPAPTAKATPPQAGGSAGPAFDPAAEARRYPTTWRLTARALSDVPSLLAPGETVLATSPGKTSFPRDRSLILDHVLEDWGPTESLAVVTHRRLLVLRLTMTSSGVSFTQPIPYEAITYWSSRTARAGAVGSRAGAIEVACEPHEAAAVTRLPLDLFGAVCAAVEPRLPATVRRG